MKTLGVRDELKVVDPKGRLSLGAKWAGKRFAIHEEENGMLTLAPVLVLSESEQPITSARLKESLAGLEGLTDNWDGQGSKAPLPTTLASAREVLALLFAGALARGIRFREPHIGCNERGQITLEWWEENRSLTVFVRGENEVDYLKVWGTNIPSEREDGPVRDIADFIALSRWLYPGEV